MGNWDERIAMNQALVNIIDQLVENASCVWLLRDAGVHAPHFLLRDLTRFDNRLVAQLDALNVFGDPAWEVLAQALAEGGPGEVFAAAVRAFDDGREDRVARVLQAGTAKPEAARGLVAGLAWMSFERAQKHIESLVMSPAPPLRRVGLAAAAAHRFNPLHPLQLGLSDLDPGVRSRALRAVGELGLKGLVTTVRKELTNADPKCRFAAAWSAALLTGDPAAVGALTQMAEAPGPFADRAAALAGRRLPQPAANAWGLQLSKKPRASRRALLVAGAVGDPVVVPWLLDRMAEPILARPAGEAFSMITGADLEYLDLNGKKPEGFEAGPTDDPADPNVELDPDYDLPWPNLRAVAAWWDKNKGNFRRGVRHIAGKPISVESCWEVLKAGYQRQRAAAATELALLKPGTPLFEVRAPAFRQQVLLLAAK
jgi:uncharacterized protein (TIGR02270 family)